MTLQEIQKEIRELRRCMAEHNIECRSHFLGVHTTNSYRANADLFELNRLLLKAQAKNFKDKNHVSGD